MSKKKSKWVDSQGRISNWVEFAKERGWISEVLLATGLAKKSVLRLYKTREATATPRLFTLMIGLWEKTAPLPY